MVLSSSLSPTVDPFLMVTKSCLKHWRNVKRNTEKGRTEQLSQGPLRARLSVPSGFRRRLTASTGLRSESEINSPLLFCISFFILLLLVSSCSVKFPVYIHMQNKGNSLSLDVPLSLKVPNVIYMKDSFPDCMSCQMEDSCREVASNVSQEKKQEIRLWEPRLLTV